MAWARVSAQTRVLNMSDLFLLSVLSLQRPLLFPLSAMTAEVCYT